MKNKFKTVLSILLIMAMSLSLCACAGEQTEKKEAPPRAEEPEAETAVKETGAEGGIEINYAAVSVPKPDGLDYLSSMDIFGDTIYLLGTDAEGAAQIFTTPMGKTEWKKIDFQTQAAPEGSFVEIQGLVADESNLYIMTSSWDEENGEVKMLLTVDKESGEKKAECKLEGLEDMYQPQWLICGDKLICIANQMAKVIKADGTAAASVDETVRFGAIVQGKALLGIEGENENYLAELDAETGELKKLCPIKDGFEPYTEYASYVSEGPVLFMDNESAKTINTESGESVELLKWHDIGVAAALGVSSVYAAENGEIYLLDKGMGQNKNYIYKVYPHEGGSRKELVVSSGMGVGGVYTNNAIAKFNRENQDYIIREKIYEQDEADKILTEIIAGEGPDVFFIGSTTDRESAFTRVNVGSNLFEDLMPYLEADEDIKKDDFLPGVLESMTEDGHIYAIHPAIQAISIAAPKEYADGLEKWDMDSLLELQANLPEGCKLFGSNKEALMEYLCHYASVRFINKSDGTCSFDNPEFARWLELIKNTEPFNYDEGEKYALNLCYAGHNIPRMSREVFGDYEYIGFPSSEGGINYLLSSVGGYSILADSENKEAAWEFIKILLSYEVQAELAGFGYPVMEKNFDQCIKWEANSEFSDTTEEDGAKLKAVIASSTKFGEMSAVSDIIMEEAQKYFADQKPLDETVQMIQSRAGIYLAEQKQ